jgi:hypothetical protein
VHQRLRLTTPTSRRCTRITTGCGAISQFSSALNTPSSFQTYYFRCPPLHHFSRFGVKRIRFIWGRLSSITKMELPYQTGRSQTTKNLPKSKSKAFLLTQRKPILPPLNVESNKVHFLESISIAITAQKTIGKTRWRSCWTSVSIDSWIGKWFTSLGWRWFLLWSSSSCSCIASTAS